MSLPCVLQPDVQASADGTGGTVRPIRAFTRARAGVAPTNSKPSPIVAVNRCIHTAARPTSTASASAGMRFIPTNCATASPWLCCAAGRAIAAIITLLDIPAAQNISERVDRALRKLPR